MSFLSLEPEARRLRRLAKEHAAGKIPQQDYRRVRRKIVEDLYIDFSEDSSALTNPVDQFMLGDEDAWRRSSADAADKASTSLVENAVERDSAPPVVVPSIWRSVLLLTFAVTICLIGVAAYGAVAPSVSAVDDGLIVPDRVDGGV